MQYLAQPTASSSLEFSMKRSASVTTPPPPPPVRSLYYNQECHPQYCPLCDEWFMSVEHIRNHLDCSGRHPYCNHCRRGFLNGNSYRIHLIASDYHHYCPSCDEEFKSSKALEIHEAMSVHHSRDCEEGDREKRSKGWEDAMAENIEREANREFPIVDAAPTPMSRVEFGAALLKLKQKQKMANLTTRPARQSCGVCLSTSSKISATRCGHVFCSSCIKQTFEKSQGCPSCRIKGQKSHLRKLQLQVA